MRPTKILHELAAHLNSLLALAAHPQAGWSTARRNFAHRLLVGLVMAGDVMLSAIVRQMPGAVAIKHRYKNADRMLGQVDLVPVARQQSTVFGREVKPGDVIAIDISDIRKPYAEKMEALAQVWDGSEHEIGAGYSLISATAVDLSQSRKAMPRPLVFEVFSSVEKEFKSEPAVWRETIDEVCRTTRAGTLVMDRAADSRRLIRRVLYHKRDFVIRMMSGSNSRNVCALGRTMRVMWAITHAKKCGQVELLRDSTDGRRSAYVADVSSLLVEIPAIAGKLWLVVANSPDYERPMVLLTTLPAATIEDAGRVVAAYLTRWAAEEMHRFAKQSFRLENVRTLTWNRTKNLVAVVAIAMGAMARIAHLPAAEHSLRVFEHAAQRLIAPLQDIQFWGYALVDGIAAILHRSRRILPMMSWLMPPSRAPDPQLSLV